MDGFHPMLPFVLGMCWHPEYMSKSERSHALDTEEVHIYDRANYSDYCE